MITAAAALAMPPLSRRANEMDRIGLFTAGTRMPEESARRCTQSIRTRGVAGTSATAFARMSVNAPAGACAQALGLLGPTSTLSCGDASGLLTIALAAEWIASRDDATSILAAAVDESTGLAGEAEGAACLALSSAPGAVLVGGWAIGGADAIVETVQRAKGERAVDAILIDDIPWGIAEASRSAVMAAVGAAHVLANRARRVVVAARGSCSVAVVFERSEP
jgi:3-oxoacyl-[acyl-carrier-protein] synthase II